MIILGVHQGHDASAAIIKDGDILADVAEERFSRLKHCNDLPLDAIDYCLQAAGLQSIAQVDYVAFSWRKPSRPLRAALALPEPRDIKSVATSFGKATLGVESNRLKLPLYRKDYSVPENKVVCVEHHLAHAASAHFTRQNSESCLVFTLDGSGDGVSSAVWKALGNEIRPLQKLSREASIGWGYSIITEALHWWHGDGEGKTMGLAPYGNPDNCRGVLDRYFPVFDGANLSRPTNFGPVSYWQERSAMHFHLDEAYEVAELIQRYGREDIAAEAQRKLEECVTGWIRGWIEKTGVRRCAFSGGVFLNVKLNQRVWEMRKDLFDEQHIFPNAGDSGLALGAALKVYHGHRPFAGRDLGPLYWGPEYNNEEIEKILQANNLSYRRCDDPVQEAARLLAGNKIIGWFQGRMESGPRALGNRSILMSPLRAENKDTINAEVKFREGFRPFCPSLLHEKRDVYLKNARDAFYMFPSFCVTDETRNKVPAVVHVDATLRPHLVKQEHNPMYWRLINQFGKLTGEYILLNTSFNIRGEPIICGPREAIRCFFDGGLDAVFLGEFVLTKLSLAE